MAIANHRNLTIGINKCILLIDDLIILIMPMVDESYKGYLIKASPKKTRTGKWAVLTIIEKEIDGFIKTQSFYADDNIHYILEIEAAKESISLGKNLINMNRVGF